MEPLRASGVVTGPDQIETVGLTLPKGQMVELITLPIGKTEDEETSEERIARQKAGLRELIEWNKKHLPKNLPSLPDEAMRRESIYEDRS